jgi:hypothetical protein
MFQAGRGSTFVTQPMMTPGIPKGSMMVGQANHVPFHLPAGGY